MRDFINEFLDWADNRLEDVVCTAWEVVEWIMRIGLAIITLPIWIIPFVVWLVFVKRKEGAKDA